MPTSTAEQNLDPMPRVNTGEALSSTLALVAKQMRPREDLKK